MDLRPVLAGLAGLVTFLTLAAALAPGLDRRQARLERLRAAQGPWAVWGPAPPGRPGGVPGARVFGAIGRWSAGLPARVAGGGRGPAVPPGDSPGAAPAGPGEFSPEERTGLQVVAAVTGMVAAIWLAGPATVAGMAVAAAGGGAAGTTLAGWWWRRRLARYRRRFLVELSPALDRLWLCAQAGFSLDRSLQLVAEQGTGPLASELGRVMAEVRVGQDLAVALDALAARVDLVAVGRMVEALKQAMELGTPLVDTLREQAGRVRGELRQQVEGRLGALPVQLALVAMACFLPMVMALVVLPSLLAFIEGGW